MIGSAYRCVRRHVRAILTLLPLIALAWCTALVMYQGDERAWASSLFQSPVQPEAPAPTRPAPEKVLPPTVQRPTPVPAPSPTPPPPPTQPPVQPVQQQVEPVVPPPDQPAPVQQPTQPPVEQQAQPQPPTPPAPPPAAQNSSAPPEIVIDSGLLIDSILVYISYVWLCCGVLAFILIPVIFLALYVLGIRRSSSSEE